MKVYLSGPMTGIADFNYPAFHDAAARLRADGYTVYSPAERCEPFDFVARDAFADYCAFICLHADAVVTLPGVETSAGATAECALARALRIPVLPISEVLS